MKRNCLTKNDDDNDDNEGTDGDNDDKDKDTDGDNCDEYTVRKSVTYLLS